MELDKSPVDDIYGSLEKRREKLERGISLLIDSYAQQYIIKSEFEPRIQTMRKNLLLIQEQQNKLIEQRNLTKEIELIVANLDQFSGKIIENLDQLDWCGKRDIIRRIVRRIELGQDDINIVYKIGKLPRNDNDTGANAQHCCNRT